MLTAFNILVIIFLFLLASIVIYSLMISDVNEQTYQFAMMRALGFRKEHLVVFIVLQAFSFAIPGLCLGLIIALLLNDGLRESFYFSLQLAGDYGLSHTSVLLATILVGVVIPLISNMGPAQQALSRNLRASLDASRRDGSDESVTAIVRRLGDEVGLSASQIAFSLYFLGFGLITYYFIPWALFNMKQSLFLIMMLMILMSILLGTVLILTIVWPSMQKLMLRAMLCCRPSDKPLHGIIVNRMDSGKHRNLKIALMITCSISFLILTSSGTFTILGYFEMMWRWLRGADLSLMLTNYDNHLNEIPMSKFLDSYMQGENPAVENYFFSSNHLDKLTGGLSNSKTKTYLTDLSGSNKYRVHIWAVGDNVWATQDHTFYIPSEVNGVSASKMKPGERLDA